MEKNYTFDSAENYDFNEDFVQFSNGRAKLKLAESDDNYSQAFASDTDFEYDSDLAEFVGGLLRQKDQRPSGALIGASYSSSIDESWAASGSLTGVANNGASVSGGKLDLNSGGSRSVDYIGPGKIGTNAGAIRLKWTPKYNGTPTDTQFFFTIAESEGSTNSLIQLMHHSNGSLFLLVSDGDGNNIYSNSLTTFMATADVEVVIEVGWDLSGGGKLYVFGQGFLVAELDGTFSRNDCEFIRIGGSDGPTVSLMDDVIAFSSNQHTANHDPTYSVPDSAFITSAPELPEMAYAAGSGSFIEAIGFTTTETNAPKYSIQIGRSGNYLYWNGSAWVTSDGSYAQSTSKATLVTNLSSLPLEDEIYVQIKVHFQTSNTQQSIDALTLQINESTVYSLETQKITPQGRFQAETLISFMNSVVTPSGTAIRYILEIDSIKTFWNGSNFRTSNGSFEQSNTKQEIEDHIVQAIDRSSYVKLIVLLKTEDDTETPEIISATIEYVEDQSGIRGYLNQILAFIGTESLTDEEFASVTLESTNDLVAVYNCLLGILQLRELVSDMQVRLQEYFLAQGVEVEEPSKPVSNIFLGAEL